MLVVGGYTQRMDENTPGKARGISVYDWVPGEANLVFLGFHKCSNPSYVLTDRSRQMVYAVSEHASGEGSAVAAVKVTRKKEGKPIFRQIAELPLTGDDPCHLAFGPRELVVSCYTSGEVIIIPLGPEGEFSGEPQYVRLPSDGDRPARAHCAAYHAPTGRLLVADLGSGKLRVLRRGEEKGYLHHAEQDLAFPDLHGPRHLSLHPNGNLAVVNGERQGRIQLIDLSNDALHSIHTANALPERVIDEAWGAALRLSKNGKMVYASDRNFSVVTALRIDERSGVVRFRHSDPSGGEHPRDLILSPDGDWLLTANTASSSVGVFKIDPKGELTHYRTIAKVPTPTAFAWL